MYAISQDYATTVARLSHIIQFYIKTIDLHRNYFSYHLNVTMCSPCLNLAQLHLTSITIRIACLFIYVIYSLSDQDVWYSGSGEE